jgi:hypothetical protein
MEFFAEGKAWLDGMFSKDLTYSSIEREVHLPSSNNLDTLIEGVSAIDRLIPIKVPV